MAMNITIVDDNIELAAYVNTVIITAFPGKFAVTVFDHPAEALDYLIKHPTDLLITDIQMPEISGIELVKSARGCFKRVIFISAYDEYALQAIKLSAMDYIVKPFTAQDITDVINRFMYELKALGPAKHDERQQLIMSNFSNNTVPKLTINQQDKLWLIEINEIIFIEADHIYSIFHLKNKLRVVASKPLNFYESLLPENFFIRVHRSFIINKLYVDAYLKDTNELMLVNEAKIPVSRSKKELVIQKIFNALNI